MGTTASEEKSQAINFSLEYPNDVGIYEITLTAKDKNTNTAKATGWIEVLDMTFPSIEIDEITNPFGDKNGNITITTHAYDDTGVANIKYKICTTAADKTNYASKNSGSWDSPTATITDLGTPESASQNRKKYNKDIKINLFEDLGIGMDSGKKNLEQTTFFFLVEDIKGNKSISKFVLPADTTPPTVKIEKIDGKDANLSELPVFLNDFKITGTWGDDSFKAWKSTDSNKIPKLVVKVRGKELTTTQNTDGTWETTVPLDDVKESGSVVGAIDVEVSITDIGGSTTKVQKGYQIDTDVPTLDYVTCDKPNGVYGSNTEIIISLYMTKNFTFNETSATSVPVIKLNNGKTAAYTGKNENVLTFKYTVGTSSTEDTDKLQVSSIDLKGYVIKDIDNSDNEFKQSDLNNAFSQNNINKNIRILTAVPKYKSHSWADGTLTLIFEGLVTANSGNVEIVQDESNLLAPAYLTKDEYNNMPSTFSDYYTEGTIGATDAFVSDLKTKYVLNYDTNTNDTDLVDAYIATGSHKRSVDIRSEKVSAVQNSNNTTTFTIQFTELPCKGASYILKIPNGLVKNDAKTTNVEEGTVLQDDKLIKSIPSDQIKYDGIEEPVIRIKKPRQYIKDLDATQQLTTTFKIDCLTPGATLKYKYIGYTSGKQIGYEGHFGARTDGTNPKQEEVEMNFEYTSDKTGESIKYTTTQKNGMSEKESPIDGKKHNYSNGGKSRISFTENTDISVKTLTQYTAQNQQQGGITLGKDKYNKDITFDHGLKYEITVQAEKGTEKETGYEVAYRTTIAFRNFNNNKNQVTKKYNDYWDPTKNALRFFIRGSDNKEGANSTAGLPCSWDINDPKATVMLKELTGSGRTDSVDYYYTNWDITSEKFYFQFMAGLCDDQTDTVNGVSQGPLKALYCLYGLWFRLPEFPVERGEYFILYDNTSRIGWNIGGTYRDTFIINRYTN